MTCIKKIKSEEISGSTFRGREISLIGDITNYTFTAKVKSYFQGKITEIAGIKNADKVFFPFESIKDLRNGKYIIEYWGDFGALGNEPFLLEELSIVSAENATNCANSDNLNFEIKIEEISIPVTISKAINQFFLDYESLTDEQKAELKGDAFTYEDFTPTQIAELQKPATDKVVELDALEVSLNTSESLRVQNENTRISNEEIRNTNEIDRVFSENSRQENEVSRIGNENERILAETERNDTETVRSSNENTRISSENTRNTNEQSRVNAENNRVTAETSRVNSENTRVNAETERASNENERKTAETARVSAENTRSTAETSRNNAETTRVNSENTRISNDNNRISAENTRVSNESGRVTAENARVTAENARAAAELERQKNKAFNVKVTTPSSWVTGTLSETEIYRFSIPANTISSQSILSIESMLFSKTGVNGFFQVRVKLTTSATMPIGSTEQIARTPNMAANTRVAAIRKKFYVNGDVLSSQNFDAGLYFDEYNNTDVISTRTLDRTKSYNVIISFTLSNASDQVRLEGLDFNIK